MASDKRNKIDRTQHNTPEKKNKNTTDMACQQMKQMRIPLREIQVQQKSINILQYSYMLL